MTHCGGDKLFLLKDLMVHKATSITFGGVWHALT